MATPSVKSTYSLDIETVRQLEAMAKRWKVSKSEALRRAIRAAASRQPAVGQEALEALHALQDVLGLTGEAAKSWEDGVRAERRAAAPRRKR